MDIDMTPKINILFKTPNYFNSPMNLNELRLFSYQPSRPTTRTQRR